MRAWVCALVVCLSLGCSGGGSQNDGGGGHAAGVGGGQAGGVGGQAGGGTSGRGGMAGAAGAGGHAGMPPTGGRGGSSGGGSDGGVNFCAGLSGATFMSLDELECGRGPDGGALCRWRINFTTATMFTWQHSDFAESGTYTCDGDTITAQRQTGGPITAIYDPTTRRLTWDGVVYCASCTSI